MMNMRRMESLSESKESTAMGEMVLKKIDKIGIFSMRAKRTSDSSFKKLSTPLSY